MAYELSFSDEFYGDPNMDGPVETPTTLWSALYTLAEDKDAWVSMCEDCFPGKDPEGVDISSVMDMIRETNTCGTLSSPVDVWIDPEGWQRLYVYDDEDAG